MKIEGKLVSGLNRGAKFLSLEVYKRIFEAELGAEPFCGTLNLSVGDEAGEILRERFGRGKVYDELRHDGREYGGVILLHGVLTSGKRTQRCVVVRPLRTEHSYQVVEIVATICFREQWGLVDGDRLILELDNV